MRAWVTTSRPVVGSSSTTSGGSQTSASGDRDALLLAARELVREAALERAVGRQVDALEHACDALVRALARARAPRSISRDRGRRRACDGFSAVPGSCGTYETSRPRSRAQLALGPADELLRRRRERCRLRCARRAARSRAAPSAVVVLPLPDSPTTPRTSPRRELERDVLDDRRAAPSSTRRSATRASGSRPAPSAPRVVDRRCPSVRAMRVGRRG